MAQKTPLPALTINYADRWHGTWFSDLSNFSQKFLEDLSLRLLILSYFRFKNYSLFLLNINNSGGYYFFQYTVIPTFPKGQLSPAIYPGNKPFYPPHPRSNKELTKQDNMLVQLNQRNFNNLYVSKLFNYWDLLVNNIKILALSKNKYKNDAFMLSSKKKW